MGQEWTVRRLTSGNVFHSAPSHSQLSTLHSSPLSTLPLQAAGRLRTDKWNVACAPLNLKRQSRQHPVHPDPRRHTPQRKATFAAPASHGLAPRHSLTPCPTPNRRNAARTARAIPRTLHTTLSPTPAANSLWNSSDEPFFAAAISLFCIFPWENRRTKSRFWRARNFGDVSWHEMTFRSSRGPKVDSI